MHTSFPTTLFFFLFILPSVILAQDCIYLNGSSACPAFQNYYIDLDTVKSNYTWFDNATDVPSFDQALFTYLSSSEYITAFWKTQFACNTNSTLYVRYEITYWCTVLIQDFSLPCNFQHNLHPPPLCQSTCFAYADSLNATATALQCGNQSVTTQALADQRNDCSTWDGLSGDPATGSGCISGSTNEPKNCGFSNSAAAMCDYCHDSTDPCCSNLGSSCGKPPLETGAIAGIVTGTILTAALFGFGFVWYSRSRRSTDRHSRGEHFSSPYVVYFMPALRPTPEDDIREITEDGSSRTLFNSGAPPGAASTTSIEGLSENQYFIVIHPYFPQIEDELLLQQDDIVTIHHEFDDGWALGINRSMGTRGAFPVVCIASAPPELVDQILVASPEEQYDYGAQSLRSVAENMEGNGVQYSNDQSIPTGARSAPSAGQLLKRSLSLSTSNLSPTASSPTQASNVPRRSSSVRQSNSTTPSMGLSPVQSSLSPLSPVRLRQHGSGVTGLVNDGNEQVSTTAVGDPIEMQFTPPRFERQGESSNSSRSSGEGYSEGAASNRGVGSPTSQTGLTFKK